MAADLWVGHLGELQIRLFGRGDLVDQVDGPHLAGQVFDLEFGLSSIWMEVERLPRSAWAQGVRAAQASSTADWAVRRLASAILMVASATVCRGVGGLSRGGRRKVWSVLSKGGMVSPERRKRAVGARKEIPVGLLGGQAGTRLWGQGGCGGDWGLRDWPERETGMARNLKETDGLPKVVRAKGSYLWDANGKRYIDGSGGGGGLLSGACE